MNVLIVTNQLAVGGAESFVVRLAGELADRGHLVGVAALDGALSEALGSRVRHYRAPARPDRGLGLLRLAEWLHGVVRSHAAHVIHVNSPTTAAAAWLARGLYRVPIVASAHGAWYGTRRHGAALLYTAFCDLVVGCSQTLTDDLVRCGLARSKAEVVLNGVPEPHLAACDRAEIRSELGVAAGTPVVLTVGRLDPLKGQDVLVRSFTRIVRAHRGAELWIAGSGAFGPALEALAGDLGLSGSVRFLGYRKDVDRLLAGCDVFCLPSFHEGLPMAICEAMAMARPVVATHVGGIPEVVIDGLTGWLVEPRNPDALADRLLDLMADPPMREQMGWRGRARAEELLSLAQMAERFENLYGTVLPRVAEAWA